MSSPREPFETNCFYHVFNHARGNDNLFYKPLDYNIFLELLQKYILPFHFIFAYCLMPNHFHFLVQVKDFDPPENFKKFSDFISHQWGNLQNTYTKKQNYRSGNKGGLFCQSVKRNLINSEEYRQMAVVYIHTNPVKHGFCVKLEDWKYSSYNSILSIKKTKVMREEVIDWFENAGNFKKFHSSQAAEIYSEKFNMH